MSESLLHQIKSQMPNMTRSDKLIAEYVTKNYEKAAYMTARHIGEVVNVCEATVVRFARKFGFDGFPQFRMALQDTARSHLNSMQRMELANVRIGEGDVMTRVLANDMELIRRTTELTDRRQFDLTVDAICGARRIYVIGTRSAAAVASFMSYYLSMIFEFVTVIDPSNENELFEQLLHITPDDVCIGISFPRYSKKAVMAMRFATDCGAKRVALTDSASSPLAEYADYLLLAQSDIASIVDSLVAPFSLVNALLVATAQRKQSELDERFSKLEHIWDEYDVYENGEQAVHSPSDDDKLLDN